tara:strand:+ start:4321 stop:5481 length:1161 start_codon:yes stop_codon:yes gene_type:complete
MNKIELVKDTIDNKDIDRLIEWLKTYPRLTKNTLTVEFEKLFAKWLGCKHCVFVNSGSSANLIMLYVLVQKGLLNIGDKVVVPSLSWATDLSPVIQLGLKPVLCDVDLKNLSVDLSHLEEIFKKDSPKALILVSVLGLVPEMDKIVSLCEKYNVSLLEDVCESLGSKFQDKTLGNFGLMSTFSTYFGHHMSTIEGGLICTNEKEIYDLILMLRSHGWDRDLCDTSTKKLRDEWEVSNFNGLYTFYVPGFNMRATDLQAYIGLGQLDKLDETVRLRHKNYSIYHELLGDLSYFPQQSGDYFVSNFAFPYVSNNRNKLVEELESNGVEVRPLICGSMGKQPFYSKLYGELTLPNAEIIDNKALYLPNHPNLTYDDIKFVCDIIKRIDK